MVGISGKLAGMSLGEPAQVSANYASYLIDVTVALLKILQGNCRYYVVDERELVIFVSEVFRQSRISYSVLLCALLYLLRFRHGASKCLHTAGLSETALDMQLPNYLATVFVSSILLASKYLNDRHPSNRTWAMSTGLSLAELNRGEMIFLVAIEHRLRIGTSIFQKWMGILFHPQHLTPYYAFQRQVQQYAAPSVCPVQPYTEHQVPQRQTHLLSHSSHKRLRTCSSMELLRPSTSNGGTKPSDVPLDYRPPPLTRPFEQPVDGSTIACHPFDTVLSLNAAYSSLTACVQE